MSAVEQTPWHTDRWFTSPWNHDADVAKTWSAMPDEGALVDLLPLYAPDEAVRHKLLVDNPAALYGSGD